MLNTQQSGEPLLKIENLVSVFNSEAGIVRAVDRVSFSVREKEVLAIVGESGCGKSVTALSILRLLPKGIAKIMQGSIKFKGVDLLQLNAKQMQGIRGKDISMIFQDPMTSLNPVLRVGKQVIEPLLIHRKMTMAAAKEKGLALMAQVGIPDPENRFEEFPHQFSGGQRQRLMIAMALINSPALLIADEPTTALDVTIQMQILDLLRGLRTAHAMAILLITHDLGIVSEFGDRVLVMYGGALVEEGAKNELFSHPRHPYTQGLIKSVSRFSRDDEDKQTPLYTIAGQVPSLTALPSGCRFSDRCPFVQPHCRRFEPELVQVNEKQKVACWEWERI